MPFIRESIDAYDKVAKKNECRIIHSCGFDSIPSDLGVLFLQSEAKKSMIVFAVTLNTMCEQLRVVLAGAL